MKRLNVILLIWVIAVFYSCKPKQILSKDADVPMEETVSFKLIQLNDIYEISPTGGGKYGGMARVAHIRDSIKAITPNTYMVMAGDFLNPSLIGTMKHKGESIKGKQMIEVMNAMEFDLVTFGNHEFDLKEEELLARLEESEFAWTSANVEHVTSEGNKPFYYNKDGEMTPIPTRYIIDVPIDGEETLPVGFFSVTINSTPQDYVYYKNYYDAAHEAYDALQYEADVIIGLTHVSLGMDKDLAESMENVPLIMGGHEHYNMLVPTVNGTIAKADANAKTVYVHTVQYNLETKQTSIHSALLPVNDKVASQRKTQKVVDKWEKILEKKLNEFIENPSEVIYYAEEALDGTDDASRSEQTNLGDIITKAMMAAYNNEVDAAMVNGGSIRIDDKLEGNISSTDIFRVLPFGGSVVKVEMKGSLLEQALNYTETKSGTGAYLQRYNLERKDGQWYVAGNPLDIDKTYKIAMSDFLLTGYDIPFLTKESEGLISVYEPTKDEVATDLRTAIIRYLKEGK